MPEPQQNDLMTEIMSGLKGPSLPVEPKAVIKVPKKTQKEVEIESDVALKGNYAKSHVPKVLHPQKSLQEEIMEGLADQPITLAVPNVSEADVEALNQPKELSLMAEVVQDLAASGDLESKIIPFMPKFPVTKAIAKTGEGVLKSVLSVLSVDEHAIIRTAYAAYGLDEKLGVKKDFGEYNWTTYLKEVGRWPDSWSTDLMGTGCSILLSPITYLTLGGSAALKIGSKAIGKATLSKFGRQSMLKIAGKEFKKREALLIAETLKKTGKTPFRKDIIALEREVVVDVEKQLVRKFKGQADDISRAVKELPTEVFATPGARVMGLRLVTKGIPAEGGGVKFFGKFLFTQDDIMRGLNKTKLPQLLNAGKHIARQSEAVVAKTAIGKSFINGMRHQIIAPGIERVKNFKNFVAKSFVFRHGVDEDMINAYLDTERAAKAANERSIRRSGQWLSDLTEIQKKDFGTSALTASLKAQKWSNEAIALTENTRGVALDAFEKSEIISRVRDRFGPVKAMSGDRAVQKRLDRFYGQKSPLKDADWDFSNRIGTAEILRRKAAVIDGDELSIWFPGIDKAHADLRFPLRLPKGKDLEPSKRLLNSARLGKDIDNYVVDPYQSMAIKRTQIAHANLQDDFFERVIKENVGEARELKTFAGGVSEALQEGFVPFVRPTEKLLAEGGDLAARSKAKNYWIKQEVGEQFNELVKNVKVDVPFFSWATNLWKGHVTSIFPAFTARNFNSNTAMNAFRIGGHAIDPIKFRHSVQMLRYAGEPEKIRQFTRSSVLKLEERLAKASPKGREAIRNKISKVKAGAKSEIAKAEKAMSETYRFDTGLKVTRQELYDEAIREGVIDKGFFAADLGGQNLPKAAQEWWVHTLNRFNPLSPNFAWAPEGRKLATAVESQARLVNYMTWRAKGLSPRTALMEVNEALFDYGALTKHEQYAKALIFPFYTFSKKNLTNHMKLLAHRPGAVAAQFKFIRDIGPNIAEMAGLPEWSQRRTVARVGGIFTAGFGLPGTDILEIMDSPAQEVALRTNPYLRMIIEKTAKVDFFSGRPLGDVNSAKEFGPMLTILEDPDIPEIIKFPARQIRDYLKIEREMRKGIPTGRTIGDSDKLHVLRSGFTSRWQSTIGMLADSEKPLWEAGLRWATGVVILPLDFEKQNRIADVTVKKEMAEILQKYNLAKPWSAPVFFGPDKLSTGIANFYYKEAGKAPSRKDKKRILELLKFEAAIQQEKRVGIKP